MVRQRLVLKIQIWVVGLAVSRLAFGQAGLPDSETRDSKSLLAAAKNYLEKGQEDLADLGCRRILRIPGCPETDVAEANFILAQIDLKQGRFEAAYKRLREQRDQHGHSGARELLAKSEDENTRRQADLLQRAEQSFGLERFTEARRQFAAAYTLAPEKIQNYAFVPKDQILPRIALCVDRSDDKYFKERIQPVERNLAACTTCGSDGGFIQCKTCGGDGEVEVSINRLQPALRVGCTACSEVGWLICPSCLGLEYVVNQTNLSPAEQKAVIDLVKRVRALPTLRLPLRDAIFQVEAALQRVEESAALTIFRAIKPRFTLSNDFSTFVTSRPLPPDREAIEAAAPKWNKPKYKLRGRANFLLGYACLYADYLRRFDLLRKSQKTARVKFTVLPSASGPAAAHPVDPGILSAFPEESAGDWMAVKATFDGYSEKKSDFSKLILKLEGITEHNVNFFAWRPEAASHLERLEKGPWGSKISGLAKNYPYSVVDKCRRAEKGRQVTVVGRFLRDRLGFPRNWFEVWDIALGLTPDQESLRRAVEDRIGLPNQSLKLGDLTKILRDCYGLKVVLGGFDENRLLDCSAQSCPVGLLLEAVAKALNARWVYRNGRVEITKTANPTEIANVASVVTALYATAPKELKVEVRSREAPVATVAKGNEKLPTAPAELTKALEAADRSMSYRRAAYCCKAFQESATSEAERERLGREYYRFILFHALTQKVPVSSFVGAQDLFKLKIGNPPREMTVRILKHEPGYVAIQSSYGVTVRVQSNRSDERHVSAEDWQKERQSEIERWAREAEASPRKDRARKFFLLAIAAKTSGLPARGSGFLDKAAAEPELAWVVETFFSDQVVPMSEAWRRMQGKPAPPVEASSTPRAPVAVNAKPALEPVKLPPALPSDAQALFAMARRHLTDGVGCMKHSLPGTDNASDYRKLARDHFEAARVVLDRLQEQSPEYAEAKHLRVQVNSLIHDCMKDMGFLDS